MLTKKQERQAEKKYFEVYGKTPKSDGMEVIDIYKKQSAYLYGKTKEAVDAYKTCQNILRFFLTGFWWPIIIALLLFIYGVQEGMSSGEMFNGYVIFSFVFIFFFGLVLFGILCYKAFQSAKKYSGKIIWINY